MGLSRIIRLLFLVVALHQAATTAQAASGLDALWPRPVAPTVSGEAQLQLNAQMIKRGKASDSPILAARVSPEGHWTFVNTSHETFTAASDAEIKRALDVLLPDLGARTPSFLLTGDSIFERRALLVQLPKAADLAMGWGEETFKLEAIGSGTGSRFLAHIRPGLLADVTTAADFAETRQLLQRPMERQSFRLVSLEPGGPRSFSSSPRLDQATKRPEVDAIDPAFLAGALGALKGQTAVIIGRTDANLLAFKPASGPERTLQLADLTAAAAAADADLLILKSSNGQQPGGRNWLWQRVEVKGFEQALSHPTLADFFSALGGSTNRLQISIDRPSPTRTSFELSQLPGSAVESMSASRIGTTLSDAVTSLVGNVVQTGALGNFRSTERQAEFDRRLVSFIPSTAQWGFGALLLLGLLGLPTSIRWWNGLWPPENAGEYTNVAGYWAARVIRVAVYAFVFMPLSAPAAAPMTVASAVSRRLRRANPVKARS